MALRGELLGPFVGLLQDFTVSLNLKDDIFSHTDGRPSRTVYEAQKGFLRVQDNTLRPKLHAKRNKSKTNSSGTGIWEAEK